MSALIRVVFLLPKKSSALVGHWYSVLAVNIQLLLGSSQLLLELVNVGNLHSVHKRQPLRSMRRSRKLELSMRVSCGTSSVLTVCVCAENHVQHTGLPKMTAPGWRYISTMSLSGTTCTRDTSPLASISFTKSFQEMLPPLVLMEFSRLMMSAMMKRVRRRSRYIWSSCSRRFFSSERWGRK